MTADDYYERVVAALKIENETERVAKANELGFEVTREKIRLTDEQGGFLWKAAVESIRSGDSFAFGFLTHIVSIGWQNKPTVEVSMTQDPGSLSRKFNIPGAEAKMLQEAGVLQQDESVSYWDRAHMYVGNRDIDRVGSLFLTDKRVVVVGELLSTAGQGGTSCRLYYDNWNQQPFLDAVDYVYMSQVRLIGTEGDWRSHGIDLTVVTKYYEDKRENLSDPSFFRKGSASKLKAAEGPVKIVLEARKLSGAENPKVRHEALMRRLKQHTSLK